MLAAQLQTLISSSDRPACQKPPTEADFKALLHTQHLPLYTSVLVTCHDMKDFQDLLTEIGLSYEDIEWWSRAKMLRSVMQVCHLGCIETPKHFVLAVDLSLLQTSRYSCLQNVGERIMWVRPQGC